MIPRIPVRSRCAEVGNAIERVFADPAQARRTGDAAADYAIRNFSWPRFRQLVGNVYGQVLERRPCWYRRSFASRSARGLVARASYYHTRTCHAGESVTRLKVFLAAALMLAAIALDGAEPQVSRLARRDDG